MFYKFRPRFDLVSASFKSRFDLVLAYSTCKSSTLTQTVVSGCAWLRLALPGFGLLQHQAQTRPAHAALRVV